MRKTVSFINPTNPKKRLRSKENSEEINITRYSDKKRMATVVVKSPIFKQN